MVERTHAGFRYVGRRRRWVLWLVSAVVVAVAIAVGIFYLVRTVQDDADGSGRAGALAGGSGLFRAKSGDLWGYIDKTGTMVIPAQYTDAAPFSEGLACVQIGGPAGFQRCFIDTKGEVVFELPTGLVVGPPMDFSEGLLPVSQDGTWGFIDTAGKLVIPPTFDSTIPGSFSDGYSLVGIKDADGEILYGFIDRKGAWAVKPQFTRAASFSEGLAVVAVPDPDSPFDLSYGFIDTKGKWAIGPRFEAYQSFQEGLAPASAIRDDNTIRCGYIDKGGDWRIELRVPEGSGSGQPGAAYVSRGNAFSEGLAEAQIVAEGVGKAGYVDKKGKWVIEPQVAWRGTAFSEGLAAVQDVKTGKWGYINTSGAYVIQPQYSWATPFEEGIAQVGVSFWPPDSANAGSPTTTSHSRAAEYFYIDRTGKVLFRWEEGSTGG